jgi:hypothetical protein
MTGGFRPSPLGWGMFWLARRVSAKARSEDELHAPVLRAPAAPGSLLVALAIAVPTFIQLAYLSGLPVGLTKSDCVRAGPGGNRCGALGDVRSTGRRAACRGCDESESLVLSCGDNCTEDPAGWIMAAPRLVTGASPLASISRQFWRTALSKPRTALPGAGNCVQRVNRRVRPSYGPQAEGPVRSASPVAVRFHRCMAPDCRA